jgi:hypothetical protein
MTQKTPHRYVQIHCAENRVHIPRKRMYRTSEKTVLAQLVAGKWFCTHCKREVDVIY